MVYAVTKRAIDCGIYGFVLDSFSGDVSRFMRSTCKFQTGSLRRMLMINMSQSKSVRKPEEELLILETS